MRLAGIVTLLYATPALLLLGYPIGEFPILRIGAMLFPAVGVIAGVLLIAKKPAGIKLGLTFWLLILGVGVLMLAGRIGYVAVTGRMEPADGMGSPVAFLIGFVFEQVFLTLPAMLVVGRLLVFGPLHPGSESPAAGTPYRHAWNQLNTSAHREAIKTGMQLVLWVVGMLTISIAFIGTGRTRLVVCIALVPLWFWCIAKAGAACVILTSHLMDAMGNRR